MSLFSLPSLKKILLPNNNFGGQIDEFNISKPFILDTLDLSSNQLEGPIPESFFKLKSLSVLSLSSNLFNGTLNLEMIQRVSSLTRLELGYNNLSVITSNSSLFRLPLLNRLNLASCNLYNFPDLRNQYTLIYLDLSNNYIAGEIPSWIWDVGGGLRHLNLSSNLLVGLQNPVSMSLFLSVVDLHSNRLQGELPIPPESAVYVDYSSNKFQQSIPVNILNSTSFVTFFSLANNNLTGTIPASLCNAFYLQVLDLSDNHISGSLPPCLLRKATTSLGVLNMRRNNINGNILDAFSVNCNLNTLDLSNNKLEGTIPPSLANCKSLEVVNVGNNNIAGTFPCWLKSTSSLRVLVLRKNKFHGDLGCFGVNGSWPDLQIIDIASNNFSGELYPRYFASWRGMVLDKNAQLRSDYLRYEFLNVGNLYYQDAVTVTIKGLELELVKILTIFTAIDFSGNEFSGEIPQTVGDLSSLYILNLSHNAFTGIIPSSIGNLKQLGSLDLSKNILTGEIPKELTYLNFLSFLNLSYNKLVGKIPEGSQFQTFPAESFQGNSRLCGFPLDTSCDSSVAPEKPAASVEREYDWQLIITSLGYGSGLLILFLPVALCKKWREYYSIQLDQFLILIFPTFMKKHGRRMSNRRRR